ncbi:MAG TPA: acyltransferase [Rhizomicrobium sp.]|nr:acyltransferase [Rhizomicrobium sp.]
MAIMRRAGYGQPNHTLSVPAEPHAATRLKTLDAFRGIAILAVLLFHYTYRWGPLAGEGLDLYHFQSNIAWFAKGNYGVQFFFIISGFVILMTLERCRDWKEFALRRFMRLYPTYIACMFLTFFIARWLGPPQLQSSYRDLLVGFSMISDMLHVGWVEGACWTLMMELVFYIWVGLIYFAFRTKYFALAWVVFCVCARIFAHRYGLVGQFYLAAPFLCYFSTGMAFYCLYAKRPLHVSIIFFATAAYLYYRFWYSNPLEDHLLVALMVLAFALFVSGKLNLLGGGILGYVGLISYPFYLLHQNIGVSVIGRLNAVEWLNGWLAVGLTTALMLLAAICVHYLVELPPQKFTRRILKRQRGLADATA